MANYGKYRLDTDPTSLLYSVRRVISIEQEDNLAKQYYWASSSNIQMPNNNKKEKARVKGCVSTTTLRNRHIAGVIDGRRRAFLQMNNHLFTAFCAHLDEMYHVM